jgi:hypothetical protein
VTTEDVEAQLRRVAERLAQELQHLSREAVEDEVRRVDAEFGDPPVKQFLPILVGREARARLLTRREEATLPVS